MPSPEPFATPIKKESDEESENSEDLDEDPGLIK